mmetsp:Transcript_51202/g.84926  ORF Transcript_51202/g.84926 Transcript_51202/m.84926 type:complete len:88 (-) Transcript_51202:559-822(-)
MLCIGLWGLVWMLILARVAGQLDFISLVMPSVMENESCCLTVAIKVLVRVQKLIFVKKKQSAQRSQSCRLEAFSMCGSMTTEKVEHR